MLVEKLRAVKVTQAWVASFEGVFHKDVAGVNAQLAEACRGSAMLKAVGVVNPRVPDWADDIRRCRETHKMHAIRVYPNYHGYAVDDADFVQLLKLAAEAKLLVQLVVKMEDERTHHSLIKVKDVDLSMLPKAVAGIDGLKLQLLNCPFPASNEALVPISRSGKVNFEFAMQESVGAIAKLIDRIGIDRVLYGSHFPLFHAESAMLKMKESALAKDAELAVRRENAQKLVPMS
jgi:predicted TIM-barrel fold metal-dependent hydrolase